MSASASQAAAFYQSVREGHPVWTMRNAEGFVMRKAADGRYSIPFWSTRSRAERIAKAVPPLAAYEIVSFTAEEFVSWLPQLGADDVLVGVNWSGAKAIGYDVEPGSVAISVGPQEQ